MKDFIAFMFSGFWTFVGCWIIIGIPFKFIGFLWNRFWRHRNIYKHGYPPAHCDADGDFKEEDKE